MAETKKTVITGEVVTSNSKQEKPQNVDNQNHKTMAALGYIFFAIPLIFAPKSAFARFHSNQGLLFQIFVLIVAALGRIPILGWFIIGPFGYLLAIFLFIFGLIQANSGNKIRLPIIGSYDIIS
jgi:uncharacterized membrane protein